MTLGHALDVLEKAVGNPDVAVVFALRWCEQFNCDADLTINYPTDYDLLTDMLVQVLIDFNDINRGQAVLAFRSGL